MSEFNGKKFYGFSLHNDPALSTTARNFEFRYTRPELLERAIQKVQQADVIRARNAVALKCCKAKEKACDMSDVVPHYQPRDMDVETHISRKSKPRSSVRTLSECEVNRLIMWARSSVNPDSGMLKQMCEKKSNEAMTFAANGRGDFDGNIDVDGRREYGQIGDSQTFVANVASQQPDSITTPIIMSAVDLPQRKTANTPQQWTPINAITPQPVQSKMFTEEYRVPEPQWVEIHEKPQNCKELAAEIMEPMGRSHSSIMDEMMNQVRERAITSSMPNIAVHMHDPAYDVVDSDLEYEMLERAGYTQLCEPRPRPEDLPNASNDSGGVPEFIEMEPDLPCMDLSFLRNTSPMRYSEPTDDKVEEKPKTMKVVIKNKQSPLDSPGEDSPTPVKPAVTKEIRKKKPRKPKKSPEKETTPSHTTEKHIDSPKSSRVSPRSQGTRHKHSAPTTPSSHSPRLTSRSGHRGDLTERHQKHLVLSKSLEDLKQEKVSIFHKMNSTQERIIELMDQLRISLMDKHVPTSSYEKHKKQKNALEFSVRFSRNFLYPLKGMIDDLRIISNDQLHSATSNEASQRVLSIFSLLCQSLQVYQKQLRYFLLDQVPQKLGLLIEMICDAISICLEKQVFARNDITVECLHDRCFKFINFLNDLQDSSTAGMHNSLRAGVTNNYNLKMFMNDLNMYEPKLVPKNLPLGRRRTHTRKLTSKYFKKSKTNNIENSPHASDIALTKCKSETVETQIQDMQQLGSSDGVTGTSCFATPNGNRRSSSMSVIPTDKEADALNKALVEALQTVTKEQVRQVLEPIMKTLGVTLGQKNASKSIEEMLSNFNININSLSAGDNRKRADPQVNERECKVDDDMVADTTSGITAIQNSVTKPMKAAKHTERLRRSQQQAEESKAARTHFGGDSRAGGDDGAGDGGGDGVGARNMNTPLHNHNNNRSTNCGAQGDQQRNGNGHRHSRHRSRTHNRDDSNDNSNVNYATTTAKSSNNLNDEAAGDEKAFRKTSSRRGTPSDDGNSSNFNIPPLNLASANPTGKVTSKKSHKPDMMNLDLPLLKSCDEFIPSEQQNTDTQKSTAGSVMSMHQKLRSKMQSPTPKSTNTASSAPLAFNLYGKVLSPAAALQQRNATKSSAMLKNNNNAEKPQKPGLYSRSKQLKKQRISLLTPPPPPTGTPSSSPHDVETVPSTAIEEVEMCSGAESSPRYSAEHGEGEVPLIRNPFAHENKLTHLTTTQSECVAKLLTKCLLGEEIAEGAIADGRDNFMLQFPNNAQRGSKINIPLCSADPLNCSEPLCIRTEELMQQQQFLSEQLKEKRQECEVIEKQLQDKKVQKKQHRELLQHLLNETKDDSPHDTEPQHEPSNEHGIESDEENVLIERPDYYNMLPFPSQEKLKIVRSDTSNELHSVSSNKENNNCPSQDSDNYQDVNHKIKLDLKYNELHKERNEFLKQCQKNRFYSNPNYNQPWKVFSNLSARLCDEIVTSIEDDFATGVLKFVQDFLQSETHI